MNQMNDIDQSPPVPPLEDELTQCKTTQQEYLNGWQRAKADFINYKNDEGRRLEDTARFMTRSLMQDILPVLDSFDLAIKSYGMDKTSVHEDQQKGMLLIRSLLCDVLKKRGLEAIVLTPKELFNPEKHEALDAVESEYPPGSVVEEIQKGYFLQGRILRPSRVRISKE